MWRELRADHGEETTDALEDHEASLDGGASRKTFAQAAWLIVVSDVSMSLDNVLAVAGAAREHLAVMVFGLMLSIALTGLAASYTARLLQRMRAVRLGVNAEPSPLRLR
jgi:predicted tellurium resistance membrane protein TerC